MYCPNFERVESRCTRISAIRLVQLAVRKWLEMLGENEKWKIEYRRDGRWEAEVANKYVKLELVLILRTGRGESLYMES